MKWIKLTKENIPDREVLCTDGNECIMGYICKSLCSNNGFMAEGDGCIMYDITHYFFVDLPPIEEEGLHE